MPLPIEIQAPVPASDLAVHQLEVREALSELGEMSLGLLSAKPDLKPEAFLGQPVTVTLHTRGEGKRYFSGYVTRFGLGQPQGRRFGYQATVRPWLWFLTRTSDCRIFQEQSVPDIVKTVFQDHGIAKFDFKLFRSYAKRTYCVQYRESDYDFVARLLEHEGIYWYIAHEEGHHTLVLVDAQSAHDPAPGCEKLHFYASPQGLPPGTEYVDSWHFAREVQSGRVVQTSYDFEKPSTSLRVQAELTREHEQADLEQFDFQGDYTVKADGQQWTEDRLDELQDAYDLLHGQGNAQGVQVGCLLKLEGHPRPDQNRELLVVGTQLSVQLESFESAGPGQTPDPGRSRCSFTAIPSAQQYRPARRTRRPTVQGPQTAVVVGPAGEEIYTDKYGRVKVQFHWDRLGQKNDKSSCWVRVSHPWAGKNFGAIHIPRIGQEVVVDFLEGDPDQPLITGRVYNAEQMPPWELPANATQSGILTRSSPGGAVANANAIRFEDKKGSEQLWIHAEKNQDIEVENDETHWVGHDRSKTVDHDETTQVKHDRTETVGNNEGITIGVNRTESVGANETITIGSNRSISVGASETATVALQRTHAVGINETITIGAAQEIAIGAAQVVGIGATQSTTVGLSQSINVGTNQDTSVGAKQSFQVGSDQSTTVGGNQSTTVSGNQASTVSGNRNVDVSGDQATSVGKGRTAKVANDDAVDVGKNFALKAGDSITLTTGSASISMKKDGTIVIKGKDITVDGSGKINIKASGDIVMKGSKILQN